MARAGASGFAGSFGGSEEELQELFEEGIAIGGVLLVSVSGEDGDETDDPFGRGRFAGEIEKGF